jgi:hypothetical protein
MRLRNPFIALTPGDIAQRNEMAARVGERICLGTAFPSLLLVMFFGREPENGESYSLQVFLLNRLRGLL